MTNCNLCGDSRKEPLFEKNGYQLVKCPSDGHIYVSNPPTSEVLSQVYTREYFEGTAVVGYHHNVFTDKPKQKSKAERKLKRLLKHENSGKLLDVGCGPGYFLEEASKYFDIEGCDLAPSAVDYANKEFGIKVWLGEFLDLPEEKNYDVVTMFSILEHTLDPRANLEKARRVLTDKGLLMLSIPNIEGVTRMIRGSNWRGFELPEHLQFFNQRNLRRILLETGFNPQMSRFSENNLFRDTNYFYARKT